MKRKKTNPFTTVPSDEPLRKENYTISSENELVVDRTVGDAECREMEGSFV